MSQSLRERIEGLWPVVSWGTPAHDLVDKADVLRIIAEHESEQAAVVMGVRPVAPPSEKVGELPAWMRELERLQQRWDSQPDEQKHPGELHSSLQALKELANLRRVILSGKGEAVIPEGVAKYLVCVSDSTDPPSPAGEYIGTGDSWNYTGTWEHAPGGVTEGADRILSAIDSYANTLITP